MSDPLSIFLGVAGVVIPCAVSLKTLIDGLIDAPDDLRRISMLLNGIEKSVEVLKGLPPGLCGSGVVSPQASRIIEILDLPESLKSLGNICQEFEATLRRWTDSAPPSNGTSQTKITFKARVKIGAWHKAKITAMKDNVKFHKSVVELSVQTLQIILQLDNTKSMDTQMTGMRTFVEQVVNGSNVALADIQQRIQQEMNESKKALEMIQHEIYELRQAGVAANEMASLQLHREGLQKLMIPFKKLSSEDRRAQSAIVELGNVDIGEDAQVMVGTAETVHEQVNDLRLKVGVSKFGNRTQATVGMGFPAIMTSRRS